MLLDLTLRVDASITGIDAAGLRRGDDHTPVDQRCVDRGVFMVENIANLESLNNSAGANRFTVSTAPVDFRGMTETALQGYSGSPVAGLSEESDELSP